MKKSFNIFFGLLALAVMARAQTVNIAATPAVGYSKLTARGASDSFVSIPLVQRSALIAHVSVVNSASVTLSGASLADGAYAPNGSAVYYLQFVSGNLAGLCYKILGNQGNAVTLDTKGDDLTSHPLGTVSTGASGDLVRIRPFWTVGAVFGTDSSQLSLDPVPSLNASIYSGADAILIPDNASVGTEKPPKKVLGFVTGSGWRERSNLSADASATEIWPGTPFIIRRQNSASINTQVIGYVSADRLVQTMPALADGSDLDVAISLAFPAPAVLSGSGLFSTASSVVAPSADSLHLGDLLLAYSNTRQGMSLPPAQRFYVIDGHWFETEASADQYIVQPEAGYFLRFRGAHTVRYWMQSPP